jgi:hypothetical protein
VQCDHAAGGRGAAKLYGVAVAMVCAVAEGSGGASGIVVSGGRAVELAVDVGTSVGTELGVGLGVGDGEAVEVGVAVAGNVAVGVAVAVRVGDGVDVGAVLVCSVPLRVAPRMR